MWVQILGMAVGNGLWAVLFCCLLFYQIKDGRRREAKYQAVIDALTGRLKAIDGVRQCVEEISADIKEVKSTVLERMKKRAA